MSEKKPLYPRQKCTGIVSFGGALHLQCTSAKCSAPLFFSDRARLYAKSPPKNSGKAFTDFSLDLLHQEEKTVCQTPNQNPRMYLQNPKKPTEMGIKKVKIAVLWIQCTRNNTILTLTDTSGKTLAWSSSGACGFKNSRKSTTHAAETVAISMSEKIYEKGIHSIHCRTKGSGRGKKKAISALSRCGLGIHKITEYGRQAFNGCRPKRKRRL